MQSTDFEPDIGPATDFEPDQNDFEPDEPDYGLSGGVGLKIVPDRLRRFDVRNLPETLRAGYQTLPGDIREGTEKTGQALQQTGRVIGREFGYAGNVARALPADIAALVVGPENVPEAQGNLAAAIRQPLVGDIRTAAGAPDRSLPIDTAIAAAREDAAARNEFPWAALSAEVSQGVARTLPKMAVLPLAGPGVAAQGLASGALFGLEDTGDFSPKSAVTMGLLPGVGAAIKSTVATGIGAAIAKGATTLENPVAQKVLEEIGHQAGLNAFMLAADSPELLDLAKNDPKKFQESIASIVANNLGFGLLGAKDWRGRVPSQTEQFIDRNADLFSRQTIARLAARRAGEMFGDTVDRLQVDPRGAQEAALADSLGGFQARVEDGSRTLEKRLRKPAVAPVTDDFEPDFKPAPVPALSSHEEALDMIRQNVVPPSEQRVADETGRTITPTPDLAAELKAALEGNQIKPTSEPSPVSLRLADLAPTAPPEMASIGGEPLPVPEIKPVQPEKPAKPLSTRGAANEFVRQVMELAPEVGWVPKGMLERVYDPMLSATANTGSAVFAGRQQQAAGKRAILRNAVRELGGTVVDVTTDEGRAALLPALAAWRRNKELAKGSLRANVPAGATIPGTNRPEIAGWQPRAARDSGEEGARARLERALRAESGDAGAPGVRIEFVEPGLASARKLVAGNLLAKQFGIGVSFVRNTSQLAFDGWTAPDGRHIFIAHDNPKPHLTVVGHELLHTLRLNNPQIYMELADALRPHTRDTAGSEAELRRKGYTSNFEEERIANFLGDSITKPEFLDQLAQRNPSLFRRTVRKVLGYLDGILARFKSDGYGSEKWFADLTAARAVLADHLAWYGETQAASVEPGERRATIEEPFSRADADLFGAPESVAEQNARLAREKVATQKAEARGRMTEKSGAKLTGKDLDTTKEMFGAEVRQNKTGQGSLFSRREADERVRDARAMAQASPAEFMATVRASGMGATQAGYELAASGRYTREDLKPFETAVRQRKEIVQQEMAKAFDNRQRLPSNPAEQAALQERQSQLFKTVQEFNAQAQYFNEAARMLDAMAAVRDGMTVARAADKFGVDEPWLQRHQEAPAAEATGAFSRREEEPSQPWYSDNLLSALPNWPAKMSELNTPEQHVEARRIEPRPGEFKDIQARTIPGKRVSVADQVATYLQKTPGAQDQADWIGLDDFLKNKPAVTREQVAEFVRQNAVDVQEVEKGTAKSPVVMVRFGDVPESQRRTFPGYERSDRNEWVALVAGQWAGNALGDYSREDAQAEIEADRAEAGMPNLGSETKFSNYQLPGGQNYRELLLTLPEQSPTAEDVMRAEGSLHAGNKHKVAPVFLSTHFDEPNILAHIRFNERTDADGKRVLFIEEVQSDWHQRGRKEGYREDKEAELVRLINQRHALNKELESTPAGSMSYDLKQELEEVQARIDFLGRGAAGIPNAPFKQTWPMLAMKRMIRYAAVHGFDRIAWTTGEQQAARYDLSKQVDFIRWGDRGEGKSQWVIIKPKASVIMQFALDKDGRVHDPNAYINRGPGAVDGKHIADVVGKELADKITTTRGAGPHELAHEGLKIGGAGMIGFYDRLLPSEVNKFVKKWGGRVGKAQIKTVADINSFEGADAIFNGVKPPENTTSVHSLDITPALRSAAMEGLPLFSRRDIEDQQRKIGAAEQELRAAIAQQVQPPDGISKAQARDIKHQATARLRNLRDDLLKNPEYAEHLVTREKEVHRQLAEMLRPAGVAAVPDGILMHEDKIRAALTPAQVARVVDLDREWEGLRQEISLMPKRMVAAVAAKLYPAPKPGQHQGVQVPSEWLTSQLGNRSPVTEPGDISTAADKVKTSLQALPDNLREGFKEARSFTGKLAAKAKTLPNRDVVNYTKDAADNKAMLLANQVANTVHAELNRAFGVLRDTKNLLRERSLTFVVEAGNLESLRLMRQTIEQSEFSKTKWAKDALHAINYAEQHFDRLESVADLYKKITDAQITAENTSGIKTPARAGGYVFHLQDVLENWAHLDISGGGGGGAASPFKQIRDHATYADSIAAGVSPKSLNAIDLLQRRLSLGQKLINYRGWVENLKSLEDPATKLPLATDVGVRVRPDGSQTETAPIGYELMRFAGQTYAIHKGYSGLFKALTTDSNFRSTAGWQALMKTATTAKHGMLLFDTFHLGRLAYWNAVMRGSPLGSLLPGNPFSHREGLTLLESTPADIRKRVEEGELTAELGDQLLAQKETLTKLLNAGLNVGAVGDNIYADWIQKLPIAGTFNKWLFEKFQRGAMTEVALIEYQRQRKAHPELSDEQVARMTAKAVNIRFGNLNSQAWVKSKFAQDLMRLVFLAPQWNESLIRAEIEAVKDVGKSVRYATIGEQNAAGERERGLRMGTLGRAVATAFAGQFIANQILNWYFRGQPTWENPEEGFESKISAYIPDVMGNSAGYFLNPLTLPAEMTHLILKGHSRTGRWDEAIVQSLKSRLSSFGRFADVFVEGKNNEGDRATGLGSRLALAAGESVPLPIGAHAPLRAVQGALAGESRERYPGQIQRQAMSTFGAKVDSAPTPGQRIAKLAREFNQAKGIEDPERFHSPFADLDNLLRVGNLTSAREELAKLKETRTPRQILERYDTRAHARFTGQTAREAAFVRTLNPEQRQQYALALEERRKLARAVENLLRTR